MKSQFVIIFIPYITVFLCIFSLSNIYILDIFIILNLFRWRLILFITLFLCIKENVFIFLLSSACWFFWFWRWCINNDFLNSGVFAHAGASHGNAVAFVAYFILQKEVHVFHALGIVLRNQIKPSHQETNNLFIIRINQSFAWFYEIFLGNFRFVFTSV